MTDDSIEHADPINDSSDYAPEGQMQPNVALPPLVQNQTEDVNFVAFDGEGPTSAVPAPTAVPPIDFTAFAAPARGKDIAAGIAMLDENEAQDEIEKGLDQVDPLTIRPRLSSCILALILALICFASAAGIYWFGVHTVNGQSLDEIVWSAVVDDTPAWLAAVSATLSIRWVIPTISLTMAVGAFIVAAVRKRWWLFGQMAVFAVAAYGASWLKPLLPRPMLMNIASSYDNSAPSGHTLMATACGLVLLVAVPRTWRALVALVESTYCGFVGISLIVSHWHRPTDVLMSMLIAGGLTMLALSFTRQSGMDSLGSRVSSASIQIVGSVMITFGIISCLYAGYLLWQVYPALGVTAVWAKFGAYSMTVAAIAGVSCLVFGLSLTLRQLTASPLTRLGLVGAPPAPPKRQ